MPKSDYRQVVKGFSKRAGKEALAIAQEVAEELAAKVIRLTPIDTTRAIANWESAINTVPIEFSEARRDDGGRASTERARKTARRMKLGNVFVVANSTPYIIHLENGHSRQAPAGMRDLTAASFQRIVEGVLARRKGKS